MTLETAATPELVARLAAMFGETLRQVDPDLCQGDVTMRVENYTAAAELRGWRRGGERAVRLTAALVENPTEAVQKHEHLVGAARSLAMHTARLIPYEPKFWRNHKELRAVDDVLVRTMRAAGTSVGPRSEGNLSGETIVYSPILRVGRALESGPVQARVRLDGRPIDVDVAAHLIAQAWEVAKTGDVVPLRLRGEWLDSEDGGLHLQRSQIVGLDSTFARWSGHELLEDVKRQSALFSSEDFERMLNELEPQSLEE